MLPYRYSWLAFFIPLAAASQPVIQHPGTPGTLQFDVFLASDPGAFTFTQGPAQSWNALSVPLTQVGTATLGPAEGAVAAPYPTADRMFRIGSSMLGSDDHTLLRTSSEALSIVATRVPAAPRVYTDEQDILRFPLNYLDAFTDPYQYNEPDEITWTYSGYGTLITSAGIYGQVALLTSNSGLYTLWNTAPLHPLVFSEGNGFVLLDPAADVGVAEAHHHTGGAQIVHDAHQDILRITTGAASGQWSLYDRMGRIILGGTAAPMETSTVTLKGLASGVYIASVTHPQGRTSVRILVP